MKNLILCFLVFITSISKGQSVDPETFPTVVGAIGSKNLYTNTGGEGKISIQSIIDSAKLISGDFIPLSGTEVGKPVTGDIEISDYIKLLWKSSIDDTEAWLLSEEGNLSIILINPIDGNSYYSFTNDGIDISSSNVGAKGISSPIDYSSNITDLDYTQKIYVDTKVAKIGADDIEITDFNKGIILTSPNSSRYRITVDNAGHLIKTLIP